MLPDPAWIAQLPQLAYWRHWQLGEPLSAPRRLKGGLTNDSFLLEFSTGGYLLRVEAKNSVALGVDRLREQALQQSAARIGLAPRILFRDAQRGYSLRRYIDGELLPQQSVEPHLPALAQALRWLHQLDLPVNHQQAVNIQQRSLHLSAELPDGAQRAEIDHQLVLLLSEMSAAEQRCAEYRTVLCHLDCGLDNWLLSGQRLWLLDWEYAQAGDLLWDLAVLVEPLTPDQQAQLLAAYGLSEQQRQRWPLAQLQMQTLSAIWYGQQRLWSETQLLAELRRITQALARC